MSNRLVLYSGGLKVSFPGRNVLTDADRDLLFTSNWPTLGATDEGSHTVNWDNGTGNSGSHNQNVYFSTTYPSPPAVIMTIFLSGSNRAVATGGSARMSKTVRQQIDGSTGIIATYSFNSNIFNDRIQFVGSWDRNSPAYAIPNFRVVWKAFAYSY